MSKFLIIDDIKQAINLISKQIQFINKNVKEENIFYISSDEIKIQPIQELQNEKNISLAGFSEEKIFPVIEKFIEDTNEPILIIIDTLLISKNIISPSYEDYVENGEFSVQIYKNLIKLKNGINPNIDPDKLNFFMCSRLESALCVISKVLYKLHKDASEKNDAKELEFFPFESCDSDNISWVINRCAAPEEECEDTIRDNYPINLPDSYIDFIKTL